jgi:predicted  nucleic acid-binding Zn-ribbon protein
VEVRVDAGEPAPAESHFFVAVCAHRPQLGNPTFVYVPRAANVLRERERHIALLEHELAEKDEWLRKALSDHQALMEKFLAVQAELEKSNRWAAALNEEIAKRRARIAELQEEMKREQEIARQMADGYEAKVLELEEDIRAKTEWARDTESRLTAEVRKQTADLGIAVDALHRTEKELEDRTAWALHLQDEASTLSQQLALIRASRWVKLGRKVGLGPVLPAN